MVERKWYLDKILKFIDTDDILLLYGSRQVGKTSLMRVIELEYVKWKSAFLDLENKEYLDLLNGGLNNIIEYLKLYFGMELDKKFYLFIDEIQYLDNPTSLLKLLHDHYNNIKVVVSWSSTLEIRWKMKDSLVWRILKFEIFPLTFEEFLVFKNKDNLAKLVWNSINLEIINNEIKFYFTEYVIWWGYPKVVLASNIEMKKLYLEQIFALYIGKDIKDIGKIREIDKFNNLLKILASQTWNLFNLSEVSNTLNVAKQTLDYWIFLLQNTFIIELITPFASNIRSEISKMPKLYFIDTWIRNFILNDFNLDWAIFENSILSFFRSRDIHFWRTQDKKEIDFIIDWKPFEVKVSYDWKKMNALEYFNEKYDKIWNIITLWKKSESDYTQFYPWELKETEITKT